MQASADIADLLGLSVSEADERSTFGLMSAIEDGLPIGALDNIARVLSPGDEQFKSRVAPNAPNLRRRNGGRRLSQDDSIRVVRIARVWMFSRDVWGSEDDARDFLLRPHAMLADTPPIDAVIRDERGAEQACEILQKLKYGSAA